MRTAIEIGYQLLTQGKYTEALPFLQRAVAEMPKEPRAHLYLALAYAEAGNHAQAERHFAQAIALDPLDAYVFYNWGAYLHRQGRLQDALKAYETAYRLDPSLIGAKQAADSLRSSTYAIQATPVPTISASPSTTPTPTTPSASTSSVPPVSAPDLRMPTANRYRSARVWIVLGLLFAAIGLCIPIAGFLGGTVCGVMAMVRGSFAGGLVVIALAFVLGAVGMLIWGFLQPLIAALSQA
ncbi:MAG: tetratricopeptide repeat protein [Armatimonadota bacterium]|nr:tetratricopeptide repeat protein [Armatimonadota bacterium]MDW8107603.1 tetratricopeptide repeat protein [Armatimonadota bacterium]